ncbi:MAG: RNA-guided pseudouridylation complex pseudouridine synthase subunit Cbf5 [Candidatus Micrarchaeota archaeon]
MENPKILIKCEEETNNDYGKEPEKRSIEELLNLGVAVIDKPCGPSSHEVSAWVRELLQLKKTGHFGTLDPNVSGVLPVALENACKAAAFLMKNRKTYVGIIKFHRELSEQHVRELFKQFSGEITQLPPRRSAVRKARRKRKVYYLAPTEFNGTEIVFEVLCEAGTYIRKLCFDIGRKAGCGANMLELRRTSVGVLPEFQTATLQELSDAWWLLKERGDETKLRKIVLPLEAMIAYKKIWIRDSAVEAICSGAPLAVPGIAKVEENIARDEEIVLMTLKNELVAFSKSSMNAQEIMNETRGIAANTLRVIMNKGVYPKLWKTKS